MLPFYNEEKNINRVVSGLVSSFERASTDYELVLVDNGSRDGSPQILEKLAKEKPNRIKVVHVPVNQGYGWGIISGLKLASGKFVGYMCGDGQIKPTDVVRVCEQMLTDDYDMVKVKRVARRDGLIRRLLSIGYNSLFFIVFNVKTLDVNGSPKVLRRELLEIISPTSKDWFIDAEIMIKAKHLNLRVGEVPVEFMRREAGRSHVRLATISEFLRNMLNYRFGRGTREWKRKIPKS